jgi:hypothetical protein
MFPIAKNKLSFGEISDYWSREIQPPASQRELLGLLEEAWWLGEVRGDSAKSPLQLLQAMFNLMHDRNDLGIVFVRGEDAGPPKATELPDGSVEVDVRRRIIVPSGETSTWDEDSCGDAFHTLAQTISTVSYPEIAPGLTYIELTYGEFNNWRRKRGYRKPTFWQPSEFTGPDVPDTPTETPPAAPLSHRLDKPLADECWKLPDKRPPGRESGRTWSFLKQLWPKGPPLSMSIREITEDANNKRALKHSDTIRRGFSESTVGRLLKR